MAALDLLLSPPVLFTLAMAALLVLVRSPLPWTRVGGVVLLVAALAAVAVLLRRPSVLDPERLPVLLLLLLSAAALWVAFHQALHVSEGVEGEAFQAVDTVERRKLAVDIRSTAEEDGSKVCAAVEDDVARVDDVGRALYIGS